MTTSLRGVDKRRGNPKGVIMEATIRVAVEGAQALRYSPFGEKRSYRRSYEYLIIRTSCERYARAPPSARPQGGDPLDPLDGYGSRVTA